MGTEQRTSASVNPRLTISETAKKIVSIMVWLQVTMASHYRQLKASMDAFRASIAERLKQLSQQAKACTDTLEGKLAKAEAILKLAERCRKLETEQVSYTCAVRCSVSLSTDALLCRCIAVNDSVMYCTRLQAESRNIHTTCRRRSCRSTPSTRP